MAVQEGLKFKCSQFDVNIRINIMDISRRMYEIKS